MQTRIRTIKPEFYTHTSLFDLEQKSRLPIRVAFSGLWTVCDRDGRFKWDPRELKVHVLPYDDLDFAEVLDALESAGFVVRYEVAGRVYGFIPSWKNHQLLNSRERKSLIPSPNPVVEVVEVVENTTPSLFNDLTREQSRNVTHVHALDGRGGEGEGNGNGNGNGNGRGGGASECVHEHSLNPPKKSPPQILSAQYDDESKKKPTQADFDERDLRKMSAAYQKLARQRSASVGGRDDGLSEKQVFEWVCQHAGITVVRGLELETLQRKWPDSGGVNVAAH